MGSLNERNFSAIEQALNTMNKKTMSLEERLVVMENTLAVLRAELANQKQLVGHVLGRGMGSTTSGN